MNKNIFEYYEEQRKTFDLIRIQLMKIEQNEKIRKNKPSLSKQEIINIIFDKGDR